VNENKRQCNQGRDFKELQAIDATGSSSHPTKSSGTATLNSLWKPVQKQEVDDVVADMFFESAIPFNVAKSPYFINACKMIANFEKGYVTPSSK
jgi:hypothetical protein